MNKGSISALYCSTTKPFADLGLRDLQNNTKSHGRNKKNSIHQNLQPLVAMFLSVQCCGRLAYPQNYQALNPQTFNAQGQLKFQNTNTADRWLQTVPWF